MLVPRSLALAPSVGGQGAAYDFATRRHDGRLLRIRLRADDCLEGGRTSVENYSERPAFVAQVGDYPIERVAQGPVPQEHGLLP